MTVFFLPPNASCYFPEAPTETSERKWSEEKQREKVTQQLRGQMKKKKRSAGLIGLRQRTEVTSRLQRICKLAIPTPSESRILTISSAPFTWDDLRVSLPCSIPGPMQRQWQSCSVRSDSLRPHRLAPLCMEFSRQEYWSGLPFPAPGDLLNPGIEPVSSEAPASAGEFFIMVPPGKPSLSICCYSPIWAGLQLCGHRCPDQERSELG